MLELAVVVFIIGLIVASITTYYCRKDFYVYHLDFWPISVMIIAPGIGIIFLISSPLPIEMALLLSDSLAAILFGLIFYSALRLLVKGGS